MSNEPKPQESTEPQPPAAEAATATAAAEAEPPKPGKVYASVQWSLVGALVVLCFALLLRSGALKQEMEKQAAAAARGNQTLELLTLKSTQRALLTNGVATVQVFYQGASGSLVAVAGKLAAPPIGQAYALWIETAQGTVFAGAIAPDANGNASLVLPALAKGTAARGFGITLEPAQGARSPSGPMLLEGAATQP